MVTVTASEARASGSTSRWTGASASVSYFGQSQANQGATASASAATGGPVVQYYSGGSGYAAPSYYSTATSSDLPPGPNYLYPIDSTGTVQATAGASLDHLLSVSATGSMQGDPGVIAGGRTNNPIANASAQWSNDSAIVTSKSGGPLPTTIQLNFALTVTSPTDVNRAGLTATINGTSLSYSMMNTGSASGTIVGPTNSFIDSTTQSSNAGVWTRVDTFHLLLPLNGTGVSSAFNLGLNLTPDFNLYSGTWEYNMDGLGANLALTSVTLPNGASLASVGDSVSFASGIGSPDVVPEPTTFVAWGLAILVAGVAKARRRGAVNPATF